MKIYKKIVRIGFISSILILFILAFFYFKKDTPSNIGPQYNFLIISVDALRSDHMGVYGYSKKTTPNIDKWAKQAFIFTNMKTVVPATYPSFSTLFTGKSPYESKIYNNLGIIKGVNLEGGDPLDSSTTTLAKVFSGNNYKTAAFVANGVLSPQLTNLDIGFEDYISYIEPSSISHAIYEKTLIDNSIKWIDRNKKNKFLLWVHLLDPHAPYDPPDNLKCIHNPDLCQEIRKESSEELEKERQLYAGCSANGIDPKIVKKYMTLYDGSISYSDKLVGRLLSTIEKLKLDKNTIVVFYADHGEGFDHNYFFTHSHLLYDSQIKIPFIIKYPPLNKHVKIDTLLDNTQIFSTLINLAGIKTIKGGFAELISRDFSLKPEYKLPYRYFLNTDQSRFAIQDDRYKYIITLKNTTCKLNFGDEELYDLKKDPGEKTNISSQEIDITSKMKEQLLNYIQKNKILRSDHKNDSGSQYDDVKKNILRQLGY